MQYMQWANGNAELDRLKRFCIAYEYVQAEKIRDNALQGVEEIKAKISEIDDNTERMCTEIQEMETKVAKLTAEKEASMGGEMHSLSEKVDALSHDLVKEASVLKNQEETLMTEKQNAEKIVRSIEELKQSVEERASAVKNAEDGAADLKKRVEDLSKSLEGYEKDYQGVLAGKSSGSEEKCLEDQLENELNVRRKDVENIKNSLESLSYEEGHMEALQNDRATELEMVQKLKDDIRILSAQLANVEFTYRDPVKNFDRTRVKGVIAKLIKVKDSSTMTALEVAAGGKRVTIIPLNKIRSHPVPPRVQNAAIRLVGKENAEVALSLVGYDEELKTAMEYMFGSTFVCKTTDACKGGCFYRRGGGDLLRQLHALAEAESEFTVHQKRLSEIEAKISELLPLQKKFKDLKAQLELKSYDLSLFQSRAEQNEHHKLGELVKRIEQELSEAKSAAKEKQLLYEKCVNTVSLLEKSIHEHANNWEGRLKDLEKKIKAIKAQVQSASKDLKGHENERERLIMEMEAVKQEYASLENQSVSLEKQINSLTLEVDEHKTQIASLRNAHNHAQSELNLFWSKLKECDSQISSILREQQELQRKISEINLERKKMENEVKRMEMEQKDCSLKVDKLIDKHAWISSEKQLFGRSGTDYDFVSRDPRKAREDFEKLQAEQSGLEKRVNKKVMAMFEKAEDEYNNLISKKNIIENDKSKIKMVIEELDEKKKETLKVTWVKVNNDFGSIFSTLLPGTMAKLEPPEGCRFLDGLEVRVAFGSVWKQSLSELSGGQRSLLAISLILALLLFKPAPLYILDEVDAALNLSHTLNIGRMIKAHFPHSQVEILFCVHCGFFERRHVQ
ncbi:hypothetical protein F0562_031392 [Nyssa sinensis]|uniref:SMC hinge domain-containing protein n=1 Tax=Nyssa sinensis TaxID=561372 RepID=A0A5J5AS05_9ASTE|nr:hypothetical protein F0562_031392 [Nyssa sinensis]